MVFLKEEKMMSDYNLDPKEIKEKLVNELEDVKMDEKLEWRILGHYKSKKFAKRGVRKIKTKFLVGLAAAICIILIVPLGLFAYSHSPAFKMYIQNGIDNNKISLGIIPTVDSEANLISLLKSSANNSTTNSTDYAGRMEGVRRIINAPNSDALWEIDENASSNSEFSKTNTQVEGVDEGDIVKTCLLYTSPSPRDGLL